MVSISGMGAKMTRRWGVPYPGLLARVGMLHDGGGLRRAHGHGGKVADAGEANCCRQHSGLANMAG
eukprot:12618100-Alexandrium_andersonii.AAC.1